MKPIFLPLILIPLLAGAAEGPIRLAPEQIKAAGIVSAPLSSLVSSGERRLPAQVVVPPAQTVAVSAPLAGLVTAVGAAYGEPVKRGQVLARMQGPQLLELQREFTGARASAAVAAEARQRDESLFADGIISRARLSVTQATDQQARALLAEKRAALRLAGAAEPALDGSNPAGAADVRAPFDGIVLDSPAQPGQRVEATTVLFKIGRLEPLWLEIQATAAQAAGLAAGDAVAVPGCAVAGKLTLVAPHLNAATQSQLLRAEFPKTGGCLKPFQFVHALVTPARLVDGHAWRVPNAAVARHQGQAWLFVDTPGGFQPVAVRVLDEAERTTLVAAHDDADLRDDRRIAVNGAATIKAAWLGIGRGGN